MSAFSNGVVFLATEQYPTAEECFERVTRDFPGCYEAWVNLGFACLMEYCDKLDTSDLRDYGIGQVLTGGFYRRIVSIPVRGRDPKLWWKAVGALRTALRIKPGLTLAKANLGLAYLLHPDGKDVGEAARLMQEAADAAAADKTLDPREHAALLINLGVAKLAGREPDKGLALLDEGEKIGGGRRREATVLTAALLYNRAQHFAARKDRDAKQKAIALLERYLHTASPLSLWWPLAYERYAALCKELERQAKTQDDFKKDRFESPRLVIGIRLKSGPLLTLGDELEEVVRKLGKGRQTIAAYGTNLKRLRYDKRGIALLASDVVLAICLSSPEAPALSLRGRGEGAGTLGQLRVGMTVQQVESLLGDDYHFQYCEVTNPEVYYRYYREQGVAVRISKDKVAEIVIVQVPKS